MARMRIPARELLKVSIFMPPLVIALAEFNISILSLNTLLVFKIA
jgi:hypothetical protein